MKRSLSKIDIRNLKLLRKNIDFFLRSSAKKYDRQGKLLLDIAPQNYQGVNKFFTKSKIQTLDIDPKSKATYTADICKNNSKIIAKNKFDIIVCTEVLEHTVDPFAAVQEIKRILKPGGILFISVPFNFRIHGPAPDCWRFTEYGLRELLKNFKIKIDELETRDRFLMPIQYTVVAKKIAKE